jgi:hypothetical protein
MYTYLFVKTNPMSLTSFPENPSLSPIKRNYIDEVEILTDPYAGEDTATILTTDSDESVKEPQNDQYRVKCKTAENAFLTFVLHGTRSFQGLIAILKSGKLIPSSTGMYGAGVYIRVNTAAKWKFSMKSLGLDVGTYGPYFLVLSIAVLDRYSYRMNNSKTAGQTVITRESDAESTYDSWYHQDPVRTNNLTINSEVSIVYLQKIWIDPNTTNPYVLPTDPRKVEDIKKIFLKDSHLAKYASIVEPMPDYVDPKYFVRYCQDWQTPLHHIDGAVIKIVDTELEESNPVEVSECYLFREYLKLDL